MEIRVNDNDGLTVFSLKGRLDFTNSSNLKEEIMKSVKEGKKQMILNLSQVDFINSSGLGTLVSILKEVRLARGRMVLTDLASYVQEIFEITQLSHIFEIFPSQSEAVEAFATSPVNVN
ncbi:MAG: STAS domain-containing protein [candidate division Zixibacteria bacterium]|nr:STAS domain-containing protein [candidate division Zixibacteria bacterium]